MVSLLKFVMICDSTKPKIHEFCNYNSWTNYKQRWNPKRLLQKLFNPERPVRVGLETKSLRSTLGKISHVDSHTVLSINLVPQCSIMILYQRIPFFSLIAKSCWNKLTFYTIAMIWKMWWSYKAQSRSWRKSTLAYNHRSLNKYNAFKNFM